MNRATISPEQTPPPLVAKRGFAVIGALASVGAVLAAASCCVLPLALTALGIGAGLSSNLAMLMPLRWPLTALAILALAAGCWSYLRRRQACAADPSCGTAVPSRATAIVLAIGTALTVVVLLWDRLELPLMKVLS